MNCSTISLARTTTNGCIRNAGFLNAPTNSSTATITTTATAVAAASKKTIPPPLHQTSTEHHLKKSTATTTIMSMPLGTCANDKQHATKNLDLAVEIVRKSNIICFDVDSTVIQEEGIDELAAFCGKGDEVARLTKEAMGGSMTFQDALRSRLNIIRPSQQQIRDFVAQRPSTLTPNVQRFIEQLRAHGKQVYLVSGGFVCLIAPVAHELHIPLANLYANKLLFDCDGEYATFDTTQPTSKSGGKAEAVKLIKRQNPDALITMIGDGATDLEAVPPADYFIGFGGNVVRAEVFKKAKYYVNDFKQLLL